MMAATMTVVPLGSSARFGPGDDLVGALVAAAAAQGLVLADGDVVCVASKVVSKVEGADVLLDPDLDLRSARRAAARAQARRVVADTPTVLIVETPHGFVCANAGIDASNLGRQAPGRALRLPDDPDASAATLRDRLRAVTGADVGVIVTDTFGRPWRLGQTDVALGAAGVTVLRDERGSEDLDGARLEVTVAAVADEIAGAADVVRRKADGVPFVLVRGLALVGDGRGRDLVRPAEEDLFRWGGATAVGAILAAPTAPAVTIPIDGTNLTLVLEAGRGVAAVDAEATCELLDAGPPARVAVDVRSDDRSAMLAAGGVVLALRAAAAAVGLATSTDPGRGRRAAVVTLGAAPRGAEA